MTTLAAETISKQIKDIQKRLKLIEEDKAQPFVDALITWYEWETRRHAESVVPPNMFQLFEFNHTVTKKVLDYFGKEVFTDEELVDAHHDVRTALNAYHMFYSYECDAYPKARFYNYFCKEVW